LCEVSAIKYSTLSTSVEVLQHVLYCTVHQLQPQVNITLQRSSNKEKHATLVQASKTAAEALAAVATALAAVAAVAAQKR
jgi:hypothetical protein